MNIEYLVLCDLNKAKKNLIMAKEKPNVTKEEIGRLEELIEMRKQIAERIVHEANKE